MDLYTRVNEWQIPMESRVTDPQGLVLQVVVSHLTESWPQILGESFNHR